MLVRLACFLFMTCLFASSFAQSNLNLYTQRMLKNAPPDKTTIDLFVRGDFDAVKNAVQQAKGNYKFGYGEYSSVTIPLASLDAFLKSPAVRGVENAERELVPLTDTAIIVNCVLPIHNGDAPFDTSYLGDGVIMGIIDFGIDFNHEDFKKSNGDTRIRYLWDQNVANVNSPVPYGYGQEWTEFEINAGQCTHIETGNAGHGTTVAGIAAGNGRSCSGRYTGMAPNTDMIVVAFNFGRPFLSAFMDAADYIFKKADAMGKPCVINASLGAYWGSHDGKDPAGLLINSLLEERSGRSLVCAAGNAGNLAFHLGYDVTTDTSFTWFAYNPSFSDYYFDFWADTQDFNNVLFAIGTDNPATWQNVGQSNFLNVLNNFTFNIQGNGDTVASYNFDQVDTNGVYLGDVSINIYMARGRYNIEVNITGPSNPAYYWSFITTGTGRIDGWNSALSDLAIYSSSMVITLPDSITRPDIVHYKLPDATQNIVSSFTCSEKVIAVGNFTNRKSYPDCNNNLTVNASTPGEIFFSSSIGPNRRGITKPDISATGDFTMASGNAGIIAALGGGDKVGYCPSGNCAYMRNGGTSMASPVVAGIAALYLQKNPDADWREIKDALLLSAISDSFTGAVPNNIYGHGKVQGCAALAMNLIYGCTDTAAFNYNPAATMDDGNCIPKIYGCTDSTAFNFDSTANTNDGSCLPVILGCIDSLALNFDSLANTDDGSCFYVGVGSVESGKIKLAFVPNFFRNETNILYDFEQPLTGTTTVVITNLLGQKTDEIPLPQQRGTIIYRPSARDAGVYFFHLLNEGKTLLSGKVVVY